MPILIIATLQAKPELLSEVLPVLDYLIAKTNEEPGCIEYEYYLSRTRPGEIVILEQWKDEEALKLHGGLPHMRDVAARLKGKMAKAVVSRSVVIQNKL